MQALNRTGRNRACTAEARKFAAAFPECTSLAAEFLPPADGDSIQPHASTSSSGAAAAGRRARRSSSGGSSASGSGASSLSEEGGMAAGPSVVIRMGGQGRPTVAARITSRRSGDVEGDSDRDTAEDGGGDRDTGDSLMEEQEAAAEAWRRLLVLRECVDGEDGGSKRVRWVLCLAMMPCIVGILIIM